MTAEIVHDDDVTLRSVGTRTLSTRPEQHQGYVHMQSSRSGSLEL